MPARVAFRRPSLWRLQPWRSFIVEIDPNEIKQVQFDVASTSTYEASLSTYNWNHTCAGSNRGLLVAIHLFAVGSVSSITYAGVNMVFVRADVNGLFRTEIWKLEAPASGTNSIAVTLSTSLTSIGTAVSYTGVDQSDMIDETTSAQGTGGTPSNSVTTTDDKDLVASFITTANTATTPTAPQILRITSSGALGLGGIGDTNIAVTPAGGQNMSWAAVGGLDAWILTDVAIRLNVSVVNVDAAVVAGITTVSATETTDYVDSATISSTTTLTWDETYPTPQPSHQPLLITLSRVSRPRLLDNSILNPADSVRVDYVDSSTISNTTVITATETTDYVETATITSVTSLTYIEQYQPASWVPQPLLITLARTPRLLHNNILNPDDSVRVNYVDSAQIATVTAITSIETTDYVDNATTAIVTIPSSADTADYVDSATVAGTTTIIYVEYLTAIPGWQQPLLITLAKHHSRLRLLSNNRLTFDDSVRVNYVDASPVASTTTITGTDSEVVSYVEATTCAAVTLPSAVETADYVDNATCASITSLTAVEIQQAQPVAPQVLLIRLTMPRGKMRLLDSTTLAPLGPPSTGFTESSTVSSITSITGAEATDYADSNTVSGTTGITYTDFRQYIDTAVVISSTTVNSSTETTQYVDNTAIPSVTYVSFIEKYTTPTLDSATISSVTTVGTIEYYNVVITDLKASRIVRRWHTSNLSRRVTTWV